MYSIGFNTACLPQLTLCKISSSSSSASLQCMTRGRLSSTANSSWGTNASRCTSASFWNLWKYLCTLNLITAIDTCTMKVIQTKLKCDRNKSWKKIYTYIYVCVCLHIYITVRKHMRLLEGKDWFKRSNPELRLDII